MSNPREERRQRERDDTEPAVSLPPDETIPEGPAFVLIKKTSGNYLRANPFALRREIDAKYGTVLSVKALRTGSLLVESKNSKQTEHLLAIPSLRGLPRKYALQANIKFSLRTQVTKPLF